jgi:hypothetical protein
MKVCRLTVVLYSFLLWSVTAYGQSSNNLIGTWHNELRATLVITAISPSGQLTGTYVVQRGNSGQTFSLTGWVNPIASAPKKVHDVPVIFTVQYDPLGSIMVWAGYLSAGKDGKLSITTIWNLVRADGDPDSALNSAINEAVFNPGVAN